MIIFDDDNHMHWHSLSPSPHLHANDHHCGNPLEKDRLSGKRHPLSPSSSSSPLPLPSSKAHNDSFYSFHSLQSNQSTSSSHPPQHKHNTHHANNNQHHERERAHSTEECHEDLVSEEQLLSQCYLSFLYPLVDVTVSGPHPEEHGQYYSLTLRRMSAHAGKLRCLRREEDHEILSEYYKHNLCWFFPTKQDALQWRIALEEHFIHSPQDCLPTKPLIIEEMKPRHSIQRMNLFKTTP